MIEIGSATNWVDMVGLALVLCLFIYGVVRGFMLQLAGLLVLVGSLVLATFLSPPAGDFVTTKVWKELPEATAKYACFVVILLIGLGIGRAISHFIRAALEKAKLLAYDRLLGGVVGIAKGVLVVMIVVLGIVNLLYSPGEEPSGPVADVLASRSAYAAKWTAEKVRVLLPADLAKAFDEKVKLP